MTGTRAALSCETVAKRPLSGTFGQMAVLNDDCSVVVTHQDSTAQSQIYTNQGVKLPSGPLPDLEKRL